MASKRLEDKAEVFYQVSAYYHSESARGVRWDDPVPGIEWPLPPTVISQGIGSTHSYLFLTTTNNSLRQPSHAVGGSLSR